MLRRKSATGRSAIVLAAGSGSRLGAATNKVWLPLGGRELVSWSLRWLYETKLFDRFIVVTHPDEREFARETLQKHLHFPIDYVDGGSSRHNSETRALEYIAPTIEQGICKTVLIHDGARPLAAPSLIKRIVQTAEAEGGALPYLESAALDGAPAGERLVRVQTPQVFKASPLLLAYRAAAAAGFEGSDTCMCMEQFQPHVPVIAVRGTAQNLKVTYPQDLVMAEHMLASQKFDLR